jgi:hypothetical protein
MAAIHCFEKCFADDGAGALRPMRVLSFESDPLTLAAKHSVNFPILAPCPADSGAQLAARFWTAAMGIYGDLAT